MFDDQVVHLLKSKGFSIGKMIVREGQQLIEINDIFMFPHDADDLAHDRATIEDVLERNRGKVFPGASRD